MGVYKRLDRLDGLKRIYGDIDSHGLPFVPERIEKMIGRLHEPDKAIIEEFYIDGLPVERVGGRRGLPRTAVETIKKRGLDLMSNMYNTYF